MKNSVCGDLSCFGNSGHASVSIISGADGPTSIFIAGKSGRVKVMELLKREYGLGADAGAGEDGGGYSVFSWLQFCKMKWNKF